MKVKIKRIDKSLPLPEYKTNGAVGFDMFSREDRVIKPRTAELLPANIIVKVPKGYMFIIAARSSTFKNKGLILPNSIGIIDQDYCGDEDEVRLYTYNMTDKEVEVKRGERICQGIFVRIDTTEWDEVEKMEDRSRGGFGSTGA